MSPIRTAAFKDFESAALGKASPENRQFVPDTRAPAQQVTRKFLYQSYFDSTLLQNAILLQQKNTPIVDPRTDGLVGFSIGLHPSSETPIAIQFATNGSAGGSTTYFLKPGQIIRPNDTSFSGFTWGLPFGWLGGGTATLLVFQTREAEVDWTSDTEVIFHRARFAILQPASVTADAPKNWPLHFPWSQAISGSSAVDQKGTQVIGIARPTKVIMVLRGTLTALASAPGPMRAVFQGTNDFGLDSTGAVVLTTPIFEDYTWPQFSQFGASGNLATQNPLMVVEQGIARLAADDGGVRFIDTSGTGVLTGLFVDIVRYGKL